VLIEPLLAWLGYDPLDFTQVREQVALRSAGRALGSALVDYELSAGGEVVLLVEAKALAEGPGLDDPASVQQILSYCHAHPRRPRWGALTDGRRWLIYDERAGGEPVQRCILRLELPFDRALLRLLSPERRTELTHFADEMSEARAVASPRMRERALRDLERELRERMGAMTGLAPAASPSPPPSPAPIAPAAPPVPTSSPPAPVALSAQAPSALSAQTPMSPGLLVVHVHRPPPGKSRPVALVLPGFRKEVRRWTQVVVAVAEHLIAQGLLRPLPQLPWTGRVVLSTGEAPSMIKPTRLSNGWFVETNWSAPHAVRLAGELLRAAGLDPASMLVEAEQPPEEEVEPS
jgi:hypothetical protein